MEIRIVAGYARGLTGVALRLSRELFKALEDLLGYQIALFNPALCAVAGANPRKAAVAVQNIDPVAVFDRSRLVVDGRYAVP